MPSKKKLRPADVPAMMELSVGTQTAVSAVRVLAEFKENDERIKYLESCLETERRRVGSLPRRIRNLECENAQWKHLCDQQPNGAVRDALKHAHARAVELEARLVKTHVDLCAQTSGWYMPAMVLLDANE